MSSAVKREKRLTLAFSELERVFEFLDAMHRGMRLCKMIKQFKSSTEHRPQMSICVCN